MTSAGALPQIEFWPAIGSTQERLKQWLRLDSATHASGDKSATFFNNPPRLKPVCSHLVWSTQQFAGYGRQGNPWQSVAGNLFFSAALNLSTPLAQANGLSLVCGMAIQDALTQHFCPPPHASRFSLKWPNDILLEEKKICGILLESTATNPNGAVIGVGLNCWPVSFAGATSLAEHHFFIPIKTLLMAIVASLCTTLERFIAQGFDVFREDWNQRHYWQDQPVVLRAGAIKGTARGVDELGRLVIETPTDRLALTVAEYDGYI